VRNTVWGGKRPTLLIVVLSSTTHPTSLPEMARRTGLGDFNFKYAIEDLSDDNQTTTQRN
uniref:hypothetical protein n=1 Tax=Roseobacter litoralis TaxID=42443 RepID=UPI002494E9E6